MFAAVVSGMYGSIHEAQKNMGRGFAKTFTPDREKARKYSRLYRRYREVGGALEQLLRV
jgi:L-ribulokinase